MENFFEENDCEYLLEAFKGMRLKLKSKKCEHFNVCKVLFCSYLIVHFDSVHCFCFF